LLGRETGNSACRSAPDDDFSNRKDRKGGKPLKSNYYVAMSSLLCLLLAVSVCPVGNSLMAQEEDTDQILELIVMFLKDPDPNTRVLGLDEIREAEKYPGEELTKKFAALLPDLEPDAQVGLIEALGERGDAAAKPAVLDMLKSEKENVRAASLEALGLLGNAPEIALLAAKASDGTDLEKRAARQGLVRLKGDDINAAVVAELEKAEPGVRAPLLDVLAARGAVETVPIVLKCAEEDDAGVRLAALKALRILAKADNAADLVRLLKHSAGDADRRSAELALLTICSRAGEACTGAIIEGLDDADAASRIALLRALARIGSAEALEKVVPATKDEDEAVRDEAVRMLSGWRSDAVVPHLMELAKAKDNLRHHVLAMRGLVRLAGPQEERPADLVMLSKIIGLAQRPREKRLVIGALGNAASVEALDFAVATMADADVGQEAACAAVAIAEKIGEGNKDKIRGAMEKVRAKSKDPGVLQRAAQVLNPPAEPESQE
jgi:HEAT repeat protein